MNETTFNVNLQNTPVGAIGDHNRVTMNFMQSPDYQALMARIEDKRSLLELQTDPLKRLKTAEELQQLEAELEQFKENIVRLAETFSKIEINTERLRQAKNYFEQGQFREADTILQAEEMVKDLNKLEQKDQQLDQQKAEVRASREQIANEFLIKAQLRATFYEQSNRFEQTCEYFAESLRALKTSENLFAYAVFLQEHNDFNQANLYYTEALEIYRNLGDLPNVAKTLNNLANLHSDTNEMAIAEQEYQEALQIRRELAVENPRSFLPDVANTLNNLANLHQNKNEMAIAEQEYQEALQIRRELAVENPRSFLPKVAMTLLSLSIFYSEDQPETSITLAEEALEIIKQFPESPSVQQYAETARAVLQAISE